MLTSARLRDYINSLIEKFSFKQTVSLNEIRVSDFLSVKTISLHSIVTDTDLLIKGVDKFVLTTTVGNDRRPLENFSSYLEPHALFPISDVAEALIKLLVTLYSDKLNKVEVDNLLDKVDRIDAPTDKIVSLIDKKKYHNLKDDKYYINLLSLYNSPNETKEATSLYKAMIMEILRQNDPRMGRLIKNISRKETIDE